MLNEGRDCSLVLLPAHPSFLHRLWQQSARPDMPQSAGVAEASYLIAELILMKHSEKHLFPTLAPFTGSSDTSLEGAYVEQPRISLGFAITTVCQPDLQFHVHVQCLAGTQLYFASSLEPDPYCPISSIMGTFF